MLEVRTELELNIWVTIFPTSWTEMLFETPFLSWIKIRTWEFFHNNGFCHNLYIWNMGSVFLANYCCVGDTPPSSTDIWPWLNTLWLDHCSLSCACRWCFLKVIGVTVKHAQHCFLNVCQKDTLFKRMVFLVWKSDCHRRQLLCFMYMLVTQ